MTDIINHNLIIGDKNITVLPIMKPFSPLEVELMKLIFLFVQNHKIRYIGLVDY